MPDSKEGDTPKTLAEKIVTIGGRGLGQNPGFCHAISASRLLQVPEGPRMQHAERRGDSICNLHLRLTHEVGIVRATCTGRSETAANAGGPALEVVT